MSIKIFTRHVHSSDTTNLRIVKEAWRNIDTLLIHQVKHNYNLISLKKNYNVIYCILRTQKDTLEGKVFLKDV
jgi:hypothetical protein